MLCGCASNETPGTLVKSWQGIILLFALLVHLCLLAEQQGEVAKALPHVGAAAGTGSTAVGPAHTGQGVPGGPREEGIRMGRGGKEERGGEGRCVWEKDGHWWNWCDHFYCTIKYGIQLEFPIICNSVMYVHNCQFILIRIPM